MCESSRYSRQQGQMTAFSFGARLHLGANSRLAVSLPQSRCFNPFSPRQLPPQREPRRLPPQATDLALLSKLGVDAFTCRGYNPSVKTFGFDTSPYTGEARTVSQTLSECLAQGSRDSRSVSLCKHREAEIGAAVRAPSTLRVQCAAYFPAAAIIAAKSGAFREAPPIRPPSTFSLESSSFAFLAFMLPPYWIVVASAAFSP